MFSPFLGFLKNSVIRGCGLGRLLVFPGGGIRYIESLGSVDLSFGGLCLMWVGFECFCVLWVGHWVVRLLLGVWGMLVVGSRVSSSVGGYSFW